MNWGNGRYSIPFKLFDKSLLHFKKGQRKEDETEKQKITNFPEQGDMDLSEAESPRKIDEMGEREEGSSFLSPLGKILQREKGSAEKKHGGDKQKDR